MAVFLQLCCGLVVRLGISLVGKVSVRLYILGVFFLSVLKETKGKRGRGGINGVRKMYNIRA